MINLVQTGKTIVWTNNTAAAVSSGDPVLVEDRVFIATVDIAIGASGNLTTTGVYEVTKDPTEAWIQGKNLYWDSAQSWYTHLVGANLKVGYAHAAALAAATTGNIGFTSTQS